jgi:enoyl-CoA hydratase/carnithine racemase
MPSTVSSTTTASSTRPITDQAAEHERPAPGPAGQRRLPADWATFLLVGDEVLYRRDGAVARLTINRPEKRNSMSGGVIAGLRAAVTEARDDPAVRVLVLTGAGDRAFCAGADLAGMAPGGGGSSSTGEPGVVGSHLGRGELAGLFVDLWGLGKPTIARVRGYALAGGFGLALSCDLVVAADDAVFGTPELDVGLWPYMITVPLVRSMPPKKALELMLTGRRVSAGEAERIGFVTSVVPADSLDQAVDDLAVTLSSKPPSVMRLGRDSFYAVWDMAAADALRYLHPMLTVTTMSEEAAEGVAAFVEKRPPSWRSGGDAAPGS